MTNTTNTTKTTNKEKSRIMKQAWTFAKDAAVKFGGSSKEYLSESLKMAWSIHDTLSTSNQDNDLATAVLMDAAGVTKEVIRMRTTGAKRENSMYLVQEMYSSIHDVVFQIVEGKSDLDDLLGLILDLQETNTVEDVLNKRSKTKYTGVSEFLQNAMSEIKVYLDNK